MSRVNGQQSPSLLFLPFFFAHHTSPLLFCIHFPPLQVGPLNPTRGFGERCKGSGAEPQLKLNFVHFSLKIWHLVATNLKIFLRIKWPNFMQNFQILCRTLKHMNSAKHWTAIASKTVTGQHGSSTVLQQVNDQSDQQCQFLAVNTVCVGSWSTDS